MKAVKQGVVVQGSFMGEFGFERTWPWVCNGEDAGWEGSDGAISSVGGGRWCTFRRHGYQISRGNGGRHLSSKLGSDVGHMHG